MLKNPCVFVASSTHQHSYLSHLFSLDVLFQLQHFLTTCDTRWQHVSFSKGYPLDIYFAPPRGCPHTPNLHVPPSRQDIVAYISWRLVLRYMFSWRKTQQTLAPQMRVAKSRATAAKIQIPTSAKLSPTELRNRRSMNFDQLSIAQAIELMLSEDK